MEKSAQKVNGISVSETPKIGERPYPQPFHPVEITPKFSQNRSNPTQNPQIHGTNNPQIIEKSNPPGPEVIFR